MLLISETEMHIACEQWLQARQQFMTGEGIQHLLAYRAASERLFARSSAISELRILPFSHSLPCAYPAWSPNNGLRASC